MLSAITPELILTSHQFLDSSHYLQLFNKFKKNVAHDPKVQVSLPNCKTTQDTIDLFFKHFQWEKIPDKYFQRLQKNSEFSTSFRFLGNEHYKARSIPESLRCYNLALQFAPQTGSWKGLAFANRSALFLSLGLDNEALIDAERALELEIEPEIKKKLNKRLEKIGKITFAKGKSEGQLFLEESSQKMRNNSTIKYVNDFVSLNVDEIKGRSLINDGPVVEPGTIILADPGYLIIADKQIKFDTEHCSNCGICVLNGIPSDGDVFSYYCSIKCATEFQAIYSNLLQFYEYFHFTEDLQDCLIITKLLLKKGQNLHDLKPGPVYDPTEYKSVFNLISHYDPVNFPLQPTSPIFKSLFLAHLLSDLLSVDPKTLAQLVYTHLHNLKYNMITLSEWRSVEGPITHKFWDERARAKYFKIQTASVATGLFTLIALCNHSCAPNCLFIKNPGLRSGYLMAIKDICKGEEFTICYNQPWERLGALERKEYLLKEYKFLCGCWACVGGVGGHADIIPFGRVDEGVEMFKRLLQKGNECLNKKEVFKGMKVFVKMLDVVKDSGWGPREEGRVLSEEFGRRLGVEIGMW